jgi:hypothetical protein
MKSIKNKQFNQQLAENQKGAEPVGGSAMRRIAEFIWWYYKTFVVSIFTIYLVVILIYGGSVKIVINWNSYNELTKALSR